MERYKNSKKKSVMLMMVADSHFALRFFISGTLLSDGESEGLCWVMKAPETGGILSANIMFKSSLNRAYFAMSRSH